VKQEIRSALLDGYNIPIRDALWGHIYLTPSLAGLVNSSPFMRLNRIMQLGPAYLVYPGATHTRASHSIGVYHLARRLLLHLTEQGADAWLSQQGVMSFLCAALLHDLGHFPYTHSLKELPLEEHEALTGKLILVDPLKDLVAKTGGDPDFTAAIVDTSLPEGKNDLKELSFYRKLLSGSMDPDKLDYLCRDARYCGVPYGVQDVDFILSRLHPHSERGVDIDSRGVTAIESLLFSKYLMYKAVYWHRAVRSATAMVKKALFKGLETKRIAGTDLYNLDDQGLFALAAAECDNSGHSMAVFPLIDLVKEGRLFLTAVEIPFDEKIHHKLLLLPERSRVEEELAQEFSALFGKKLKENAVIIDLPETISFESGLYISDENCPFSDGSSIMKNGLVDAFVKSLRIIRVFVDSCYEAEIKLCREGILNITQKRLQL